MQRSRRQVLAGVLAVAVVALLGGAVVGTALSLGPVGDANVGSDHRPDEPSTSETVGYVEGYWYDDELPVDDRDGAVLEESELEPAVYRSMARVEQVRGLTFERAVPVDVVSREEFQEEDDALFANLSRDERLQENVNFEALFMVDRDTDAEDEVEALYGDAVGGYYDPATEEIVLVSENPETPETDEVILGHELHHALQDQHFDLGSFDRETIDEDAAKNGLIEGDATAVENEYAQRCASEWDCLEPTTTPQTPTGVNWGMMLIVTHPYEAGPDYVDYLRETGGWEAVDAAYDDPPASSSEVIRPGEEREPVDVDVADRSSAEWQQFEIDGEVATETAGEVGMVSMLAAGALDPTKPSVIDESALVNPDLSTDYDHPYTDGWAGDELVTYVHEDAAAAETTRDALDHAGYVWQSEWTSEAEAAEFVDGYLELLDIHDADAVDDREDTYVIEEDYPGAYAIEYEDETVTIVRAPSVDDLEAVHEGVGPTGSDTVAEIDADAETHADGESDESDTADDDDAATDTAEDGDAIGTPGSIVLTAGVVLGTAAAFVVFRGGRGGRSADR
ncbi:Hvo_1808 family surface protein [Halopiger goleimassiliensis]|uniref:Hvo_1808 family surface protein n=1 Tax=Halopiger goleimassiliensis TaxID=1293048 RepID=UPI0009DBCD96|nr:Hvo_1808 family surface protein [Halopiger goleimassiliensis]